MSKKVYFKSVDAMVVSTINEILDVTFTHAYVSKELYKDGKAIEKTIDLLKDAIALGENKSKELESETNKLNIVNFKKKAIVAWRKNTLYDTKDNSDNWVDGLYTKIGITKELAEKWAECMASNTWGKWNDEIRTMLTNVYGMDIKDDKLVARFASYLEHSVGLDLGSTNDILKGILLKDKKSFNKFAEVFIRAIATYMAKSNEEINIPTVEFYVANVKYDKNYKTVTDYTVTEKEEETTKEDVA